MTAASIDPIGDLVSVTVSGPPADVRVIASGEIDSTSAPVLREHLELLLDGDVRRLTVDLSQVSFLDSAGLCVLAAAHRRAARQGVSLRVLAASRAVVRPLQITGLWELLHAEHVEEDRAGSSVQGVA